jgi:phosphoribosylformylglycinamidine cyclo-ligase
MVGILKGCELADVELIGGETAEHFRQREYDLAGFCTGLVEKKKIIDGSSIKPSDIVIGLESSGLHSNGYTLINDMLWRHKIFYKGGYEESFGEDIRDISPTPELLTPTRIYTSVVKRLLDEVDTVYGMAHITGGGIPENLPRCLPEGLTVRVDYNSWPLPDIFKKIQLAGEIDEEEMKRVFNLGIGYCVIVPANTSELTRDIIRDEGINCWEIGEVYE